jgi:hypothetical protein
MEISIENQPFASTNNYAGVYTDETGRDFGFTIVESINVDLALCGIEEIVWVDCPPEDQFEIESQIESEFKSTCND